MFSTRSRLAAVLLPLTVAVAACGGQNSGDAGAASSTSAPPPATATATQSAELAGVQVETKPGAEPTLKFPTTPFTMKAAGHRVLKEGTGDPVGADQTVDAHLLIVNAKDGKKIESRFGSQAVTLKMNDESLVPAIKTALVGQKVGSQVLVGVPAKEAFGDQGNPQVGVAADDTLVFYFEITGAKTPQPPLKEATGKPVPPKAGLPTVAMGKTPADPAVITVPKSAPPKSTVVQPLIEGTGATVAAGQEVSVSYTGTTWANPGKPFDWSGKHGSEPSSFPIGVGKVIKGWDQAIVGAKVGSRLLIVVPPADGYGAQGNPEAGIKGTDTLVFVVDILAAN